MDPSRTLSSPPILQCEASCVALLRMLKGLVWATSKPATEAPVSHMTAEEWEGQSNHTPSLNKHHQTLSQSGFMNYLLSVALCQAANTSSFPSINLLYFARLMARRRGRQPVFQPVSMQERKSPVLKQQNKSRSGSVQSYPWGSSCHRPSLKISIV